jgi:hypothetical protein
MKTMAVPAQQRSDPNRHRKHPLYKHSHQWIDRVNLAMTRRIEKKIRERPELMKVAWAQLRRWKRMSRPWPACFREWERILKKNSTERVLQILTQDNDEGQRLRQSDPFIGILTEEERTWFLEEYEEEGV